jgi:hypothetical protein
MVIRGRVFELGSVPAKKMVTATLDPGAGTALDEFVRQHGEQFQRVVRYRQQAFGRAEPVRIRDVPLSAMAASFVSELPSQNTYEQFVAASGLDVAQTAQARPILLAWVGGFAPVERLNQFTARRGYRNTLLRVSAADSKPL